MKIQNREFFDRSTHSTRGRTHRKRQLQATPKDDHTFLNVEKGCLFVPLLHDTIETLGTPTEQELDIFRVEMDVAGQFSSGARWITREGEEWCLVQDS